MNQIDSAFCEKRQSARTEAEESSPSVRAEGSWQVKTCFLPLLKGLGEFFGTWNLDIVCYLLFGAWDFLYPKTPLP
jgi:hypothetical protein